MSASEDCPGHMYKSGDRLTLSQAAALFAARDIRPHEKERQAIDRWRKRVREAELKSLLRSSRQTYEITELVSWAQLLKVKGKTDWPLTLGDLPRKPAQNEVVNEYATVSGDIVDLVLPADLNRSHDLIRKVVDESNRLRQQLSLLQTEVSMLRPKAEQYDRICKNNRLSGRRPKTQRNQNR